MKPELTVIITWCDRPELRLTLDKNRGILDRYDVEVVVVNCGGSDEDFRRVLGDPKPRKLRSVSVQTSVFNKSLALNLGASIAQSDQLFLLDADIILNEDFLVTAFDSIAARHFFTVQRVLESNPELSPADDHLEEMHHQISFVASNGRKAVATVRRNLREGSRNAPGLVLLAREHFLRVGGMNSDLEGYGWEDRDLLLRLQFVLGMEERSAGTVLHLSHKDEQQHLAWRDRQKGEHRNFVSCMKNYRAGHYSGTYHDDLVVWKNRFSVEDF